MKQAQCFIKNGMSEIKEIMPSFSSFLDIFLSEKIEERLGRAMTCLLHIRSILELVSIVALAPFSPPLKAYPGPCV